MAYKRWIGALAASTLTVGLAVGTGATQAFAASARAHTNMRASARVHVHDHAAVVLARALRRSLAARGTRVVSMRAATHGRMHGYLVTWARGHVRGRLFVDSRTGHAVRMRAESAATTTTGVSLSAFLSALETTLAAEAGAPVTAQSEDNGAIVVFTLNVGGQTITVTVNTGAQTTGVTSTTNTTTSTLQAPPVSMESAVNAAIGTTLALGTASFTSPYAVAAEFAGWQQVYGGAGAQAGDQGLGLDLGSNLSDQIQGSLSQPAYVVVVNSAQGGQADVVESSTFGSSTSNLPSLLGLSLSGASDGQAMTAAPAVTLNTAVTSAMATDSGGIPVKAELSTGDSANATWQVELVNPDGSLSQITIDATTGAVIGQSSQTAGDQGSSSSQGSAGSQGDQGDQGSQGGDG